MASFFFNAAALCLCIYSVLLLIAAALPKSKHDDWHNTDGK